MLKFKKTLKNYITEYSMLTYKGYGIRLGIDKRWCFGLGFTFYKSDPEFLILHLCLFKNFYIDIGYVKDWSAEKEFLAELYTPPTPKKVEQILDEYQIAEIINRVTSYFPRPDGSFPKPWEELDTNTKNHAALAVKEIYSSGIWNPEQLHELWMKPLLEAGWTFGETYSKEDKKHPCLIPYEELNELDILKDHIWQSMTSLFSEYYKPTDNL